MVGKMNQVKNGQCKHCGRVRVERPRPNHTMHAILTTCTCGLWLVVWLGSCIRIGGWRCSQCGGKAR